MAFHHGVAPHLLSLVVLSAAPRLAAADEGQKAYQESCTACHNATTRPLEGKRLTREQWKEAIEKMEGLGADVPSGQKRSALLDYLEATHGPSSPPPGEAK
jgi:cytochrome c5